MLVLAAILIVVWGFIGVRFALLSREHKAKQRAQEQAAAQAQTEPAPGVGELKKESPTLRLAALVAPVPPPKSDPFRPLIAARSSGGGEQPAPSRKHPTETGPAPPLLPPLPGSESSSASGRDRLQLTGIIVGTPSTAVLRLGEDHYVVREGDVLDTTLRVQRITKTTVILRDARMAYTLRLGG